MQLQEKLSELEKSDEFASWKKDNKNSYLAHVFRMFDEENKNIWQFGYYNKDDTITTFMSESGSVKKTPEQNIFKKDKAKVPKLDVKSISVDFLDAMKIADSVYSEKYSKHPLLKSFAILQKIGEECVFNVTYVTQTFNTLNIHIGAADGQIKKEKLASLMDMVKVEKGLKKSGNEDDNYIG
jgi:hypothetical protein